MNFHVKKCNELLDQIEDKSMVLLTSGKPIKSSADENYQFCVNRNFYYLTGINDRNVILMLIKAKGVIKKLIFIEKPDLFMEKWVGKTISKDEAKLISGIEQIEYLDNLNRLINHTIDELNIKNIYIDDEDDKLIHFGKDLISEYSALEKLNEHNIYASIVKLRSVKEQEEIDALKLAIHTTNEGIINMLENLKPMMYENEIEAYFDHSLKDKKKARAFTTIAAGGKRGTTLHYITNDQIVNDNELILFDLGATEKHYCADISRTFPINGKFTKRQREIYEIVLLAQRNVINAIKPGLTTSDLQKITIETYQKELKRIGLIKNGTAEEVRKYYFHGVSHSLGLDTHDVGLEHTDKLVPGCVITVEPGLYLEEEEIGIRIEDDVLVTVNGCEILSKEIIKEVDDIELFFAKRK